MYTIQLSIGDESRYFEFENEQLCAGACAGFNNVCKRVENYKLESDVDMESYIVAYQKDAEAIMGELVPKGMLGVWVIAAPGVYTLYRFTDQRFLDGFLAVLRMLDEKPVNFFNLGPFDSDGNNVNNFL